MSTHNGESVAAETVATDVASRPNAALYATVRAWPIGLDLTIGPIDLAEVLAYDVLRIFGRLYQQHAKNNEVIGDGRN